MSNELDKYLHTVAHELRGLEAEQREAELREMRGHLEAIVARLMDSGASEAEAAKAAIEQFGTARQVGNELQKASGERDPWWRIVLAPVAGLAAFLGMSNLEIPLQQAIADDLRPWLLSAFLTWILQWPLFVVAGAIAELISPKRGGRLLLGLIAVPCIASILFMIGANFVMGLGALTAWPAAVVTLCSSSGIWFGARWANRHLQRRKDAQRV